MKHSMKSILISIKPEWVEKILNGEKTIEIRKTAPKCELPIDVYIYCSDPRAEEVVSLFSEVAKIFTCKSCEFIERKCVDHDGMEWSICNGKVVAKFTLREVERIMYLPQSLGLDECDKEDYSDYFTDGSDYNYLVYYSKVKASQIHAYLRGRNGYAWHISDLEIFDKPKKLSEFYTLKCNQKKESCNIKDVFGAEACHRLFKLCKPLTKAPQSWCYVEVEK